MPSTIRTTPRSSKVDTSTRQVWLLTINCLVACVVPPGGQIAPEPEPAAIIVVEAGASHLEAPPDPGDDPGRSP